jgi:hypothetical protein
VLTLSGNVITSCVVFSVLDVRIFLINKSVYHKSTDHSARRSSKALFVPVTELPAYYALSSLLSNRDLCRSPSRPAVMIVKLRKLRWARRVARMGEIRNDCRVWVGKPLGERPLRDSQLYDCGHHGACGNVFECPRDICTLHYPQQFPNYSPHTKRCGDIGSAP